EVLQNLALLRRELRRTDQAEVLEAEPCARELCVIGRAVFGRLLVVLPRIGPAAERIEGAALPVAAARDRVRVVGAFGDVGENLRRGLRVLEKAQRDPAGEEVLAGAVVVARR